jgi:BON domain-containing protein
MANQNGRAYPGRNAHLPGLHRDDDRGRSAAMRDDDRGFDDRDEPERSWRPEDRGERFDQRFDARFDRRFDDQDDRRRGGRHERFSESDRGREPYGIRDREDRGEPGGGEPGRGELRIDLQGYRTPDEARPRQDRLLRGAYRDHDESSRDLSYRAGPPHAEPYGPTGERTQESRGGADLRGRMPHRRGPHAGRGPVGFQRSDDRIRELVCEALTDDGEVDASHIEVSVKAGEVTLTGAIEDRRMKRLAEDCVEAVPGVKDVHNQLRIGATAADRSGHDADRAERSGADKQDRHTEPSDRKHRPS